MPLGRSASDTSTPLRSTGRGWPSSASARRSPTDRAGVFNSGVLAGGSTFDYESASPETLRRRDTLAEICRRHRTPLAAAAIQFPLGHPAVRSILVGARSPEEIRRDAQLLTEPVPDALWPELARA
jgi:D-threo-aldose 1-dehydrogenase